VLERPAKRLAAASAIAAPAAVFFIVMCISSGDLDRPGKRIFACRHSTRITRRAGVTKKLKKSQLRSAQQP
jgi:hypothetical protein